MLDTELSETALLKHSYLTILPLMIKGWKISLLSVAIGTCHQFCGALSQSKY